MKRTMRVLSAAVLLALAPMAQAQANTGTLDAQVTALDQAAANRGQTQVAQKIASNFTHLAGSEDNALALVKALRAGDTVKLTYPAPTGTGSGTGTGTTPTVTSIDPPTARMGWGNVKISLALAQDALARAGITNPTGEQLQAALNGGSITVKAADGTTSTLQLKGILQMRADGMGWGEIAKASGTKVGPVVSQLRMANTKVRALPPTEGPSTASAPAAGKSVKTAAGETPTSSKSKGVTTGSDASAAGKGSRGITTATGSGATHGSKGLTTATGASGSHGSKGLVTADGAVSSSGPKGNASGRGVVTAAGGGATNVAAAGRGSASHGHGAGVVNAGGGASSGVTTANGNAGGNGKGQGSGKGKGPGGG